MQQNCQNHETVYSRPYSQCFRTLGTLSTTRRSSHIYFSYAKRGGALVEMVGKEGGTRKEATSTNKNLEERTRVNRHLPPLLLGDVKKSIDQKCREAPLLGIFAHHHRYHIYTITTQPKFTQTPSPVLLFPSIF